MVYSLRNRCTLISVFPAAVVPLPLIWTLTVNSVFLISLLIYLFPLLSLSLYTPSFHSVFLLFFSFSAPLASQMVFPRYDHGFLSGDQSGSFQRRFLKVDNN